MMKACGFIAGAGSRHFGPTAPKGMRPPGRPVAPPPPGSACHGLAHLSPEGGRMAGLMRIPGKAKPDVCHTLH